MKVHEVNCFVLFVFLLVFLLLSPNILSYKATHKQTLGVWGIFVERRIEVQKTLTSAPPSGFYVHVHFLPGAAW